MKLAVITHPSRDSAVDIARSVVSEALARGMTCVTADEDAARLRIDGWGSDPSYVDFVVAVGGDGTVLEATRVARAHDLPVLGVNAGTVGFLAEVDPGGVGDALDRLVADEYRISIRMTLDATFPDGRTVSGLNDLVVEKAVSRQTVAIGVAVAGEELVEYRTDAVIVATPTGSTAYTFSAGGPLVDPELEALVVTAVAPHNLFGRPIVFGVDAPLEVFVAGDRHARANVDGLHESELAPGDRVQVVRGDRPVRLVRFSPRNFARTVKEKFHLHDA